MNSTNNYDIIVIGGGHAGIEAALAAARLNKKTALITMVLDSIGQMSCNPSIGGPGKSHLISELDILGGEMGKHIDKYNLQLKHLNTSKGPAAKITRAQADKHLYQINLKSLLENTNNLDIIQEEIAELITENNFDNNEKKEVKGVISTLGIKYFSKKIILATGTFLNAQLIVGDKKYKAGRQGEKSANYLSDSLIKNGIQLKRYQTATPPRINAKTVNYNLLKEINGEKEPNYFSLFTKKDVNNLVPTWLTHTSENTITVTQDLLKYSPIVTGTVNSNGPRHCPSLDRKVLRFPDKKDHQIFLELESQESNEIYVNGLTTAMPPFAQKKILQSIKGLENAEIMRFGYAVEYDYAPAKQLHPTLESKKISGLYFAGQINGTSGYEEAAVQGFIAGINAVKKINNEEEIIIDKSEGYIGVLINDIIHKETPEPYRVLPSRADFRLTLRFDNAFLRLLEISKKIGILSKDKIKFLEDAKDNIIFEIKRLKNLSITKSDANKLLEKVGETQRLSKGVKLSELLTFKNIKYDNLKDITEITDYPKFVKEQIEISIKYEVFIAREEKQILKFKKLRSLKFTENFNFNKITGLSNIAKSSLSEIQPLSIEEAQGISGVTNNDIALLIHAIKKFDK